VPLAVRPAFLGPGLPQLTGAVAEVPRAGAVLARHQTGGMKLSGWLQVGSRICHRSERSDDLELHR